MINAGQLPTCVIDSNEIKCWGHLNSNLEEREIPEIIDPITVSSGSKHVCALSLNGVNCWGSSAYQQTSIPRLMFDADSDGYSSQFGDDVFPLDPLEWIDTDNDGIGNNSDIDDDNDGYKDVDDIFPLDPSEWIDSDLDKIGDNSDAFPQNPSEQFDTDGDGLGDNYEIQNGLNLNSSDSDDDGYTDSEELNLGNDPLDKNDIPVYSSIPVYLIKIISDNFISKDENKNE